MGAFADSCDAGYYYNENNECVACTSGYYCTGDGTRTKCPDTDLTVNQLAEICSLDSVGTFSIGSKEQINIPNVVTYCSLHLNAAFDDKSAVYAFVTYDKATHDYTNCHKLQLFTAPQNGYYLGDVSASGWSRARYACTNVHPEYSHYSGPGTPNGNDCPWECDDGYGKTDSGSCLELCESGITSLHIGEIVFNVYANKQTTPSINIKHNDTVCYVSLSTGTGTDTLHIQSGDGTVYHAIN